VPLEEQTEGFFRAQLGNSREVLHAEAIQNFSPFQLALTQTQRALYGIGRHC